MHYVDDDYESHSESDERDDSMRVLDSILDFAIDNKTNEFEIVEFLNYEPNFNHKMLRESIRSTKNFFKINNSKIHISKQVIK